MSDGRAKVIIGGEEIEFFDAAGVKARLAEMVEVMHSMPATGTKPAGFTCQMPEPVRSFFEAYNMEPASVPRRSRPSAKAVARANEALDWLVLVTGGRRRRAVWGMASGMSLRKVASVCRCSHETVRTEWRDGIEEIVRHLNSDTTDGGRKIAFDNMGRF